MNRDHGERCDFLIVGAGVIGLAIARELKIRNSSAHVVVLEKESQVGRHASGRNSGVLHSGIYYPAQSLKAKVCSSGAREMAAYCTLHSLPLVRRGKILLPMRAEDGPQLDLLEARGLANGVSVKRLDATQLRKIEPEVCSATGEALLVSSTAVVNPTRLMAQLANEVLNLGVVIRFNSDVLKFDPIARSVDLRSGASINYHHLINCAGLHADTVAHEFGVGLNFTLMPFKGIYWKLDPAARFNINHLVYPVPDLRVPFLGVHTTTDTEGVSYLGPTAVPAFGRENYHGTEDLRAPEMLRIAALLAHQLIAGKQGFRRLAWQEGNRYFKHDFVQACRALLPRLKAKHLLPCNKVGIRAQMFDRKKGTLVMDFLVERGPASTHILNAISPAWTSAFPFARFILENYIDKQELQHEA